MFSADLCYIRPISPARPVQHEPRIKIELQAMKDSKRSIGSTALKSGKVAGRWLKAKKMKIKRLDFTTNAELPLRT